MDAVQPPFSAPTSSFVLDEDAMEEARTHLSTTAATASTLEQETAARPEQASVQAPQPALTSSQHVYTLRQPQQLQESAHVPAALEQQEQQTVVAPPPPSAAATPCPLPEPRTKIFSTASATAATGEAPQQQPAPLQQQAAPAIVDVLGELAGNAADIRAAGEALQDLLTKQHRLSLLLRKLEQQQVIAAVLQPMGFHQGRPVAALLLLRCFKQWGVLTADSAPVLDQLACLLQQQLSLDDESAPAEVAGLQCHVAYWLTVSAVLLCLLLKTTSPQLAAAAAAQNRAGGSRQTASAVMTAARRRVGELQQQLAGQMGHMGGLQGGLQALGQRFKGWGKPAGQQQQQQQLRRGGSGGFGAGEAGSSGMQTDLEADEAAGSRDAAGSHQTAAAAAAATSAAAAAGAARSPASLQVLLLCLDSLVQRAFAMLRDQLKRRLAPLLSDCMVHPGLTAGPDSLVTAPASLDPSGLGLTGPDSLAVGLSAGSGPALGFSQPDDGSSSSSGSGQATPTESAVAGSAAASAAEAEAALLCYRSWSEVVGVLHAAVVALRAAGVPRALTAALLQQVLEFVNCQLFNQLLLRPECCSAGNARYVLRGLQQLDGWLLAEHGSATGHEAAAAAAAAAGGAGSAVVGDGSSGSRGDGSRCQGQPEQRQAAQEQAGTARSGAAAAAGGGGADGDGGWEQVPADTGEIDSWQPPQQQQQQQQQQSRVRLWQWQMQPQEQQQQQQQHDIGPEAWHALSHIRQALQFLVLERKGCLSLAQLAGGVCPALSHQQLYRLCTTAWDEAPGDERCVSGEVLEQMKQQHALSSNGGLIVTYLLDEPPAPPFLQPAAAAAAASDAGFFNSGNASAAGSGGGWRCKPSAVVCWDDGRDYGVGMPVPRALVDEGCPAAVFAFLEERQPWVQY